MDYFHNTLYERKKKKRQSRGYFFGFVLKEIDKNLTALNFIVHWKLGFHFVKATSLLKKHLT